MFWLMTMTPTLETWLTALESGEYTQVKGQLRVDDKFCCLGVACDLRTKDEQKGQWDHYGHYRSGNESDLPACKVLPAAVSVWLLGTPMGHDRNPLVAIWDWEERVVAARHVSQLNDLGMSFVDLAKTIRANLRGEALAVLLEGKLHDKVVPLDSANLAHLKSIYGGK